MSEWTWNGPQLKGNNVFLNIWTFSSRSAEQEAGGWRAVLGAGYSWKTGRLAGGARETGGCRNTAGHCCSSETGKNCSSGTVGRWGAGTGKSCSSGGTFDYYSSGGAAGRLQQITATEEQLQLWDQWLLQLRKNWSSRSWLAGFFLAHSGF